MTTEGHSPGACMDAWSPSRRAYLECRQAEAISQIVCLLFRDLLLTQSQTQLLKGDHTDVAGHVVTLRVQRVSLAGVKVVNKATCALNTHKRKEILNKVSHSRQFLWNHILSSQIYLNPVLQSLFEAQILKAQKDER